jgi:hypothetical protein
VRWRQLELRKLELRAGAIVCGGGARKSENVKLNAG